MTPDTALLFFVFYNTKEKNDLKMIKLIGAETVITMTVTLMTLSITMPIKMTPSITIFSIMTPRITIDSLTTQNSDK
jgi:hypothetical protein